MFIIYLLKICLICICDKFGIQQIISPRGVITWSVLHRGGGGGGGVAGCNNVYRITSKWRPDILNEIEYFVLYNYNVFFLLKYWFPWNSLFLCDQFSLLIYLCVLPSSATVKMDNGENLENARYAMNDDTAGFINQKKNRNTSTKTEYDLKLMKNYFASIYT